MSLKHYEADKELGKLRSKVEKAKLKLKKDGYVISRIEREDFRDNKYITTIHYYKP